MNDRILVRLMMPLMLAFVVGCDRNPRHDETNHAPGEADEHDAAASGRVEIPATVRQNLGISFAKVESRPVAHTIRVPGQFELQPEARREYRTMLAGRVELLVRQYEQVEAGTTLYRLASPEWRVLQEKLTDAESTIRQIEARVASIPTLLAAHRKHEESLRVSVGLWERRVEQIDQTRASGVVTADEFTLAQNTLATQRADLAEVMEKEAQLEAQSAEARAQHDAAHARFRLLLATASTLLGIPESELSAPYHPDEHMHVGSREHVETATRPVPRWREIDEVEVIATMPGFVQSLDLTNGAWASAGALVLSAVDPGRLRFRAMAMQSDLGRLRDGLSARIVPPKGGSIELQDAMDATLRLGLTADARERTIELVAIPSVLSSWARPGVAAHLEIIAAGGESELAVPLSCVIQDGLSKVIFRRDPNDPDIAIRMEADLGVNDGRWVAIKSGVREGDEVVLDGVYQLMIATSGSVEAGGHFHSDGTFHAGEDEKE